MKEILTRKSIPHTVNRVGPCCRSFFIRGRSLAYEEALQADKEAFRHFFGKMLDNGVYLAPSPFEAWFVSASHTDDDIEKTLEAVQKSV